MAPSGAVRIWWDTDLEAYRLVTPFNRAFVDAFKAFIPGSDRAWDDSSKSWSFTERYLQAVEALTEKLYGGKPTVITRAQSEKSSVPPSVAKSPIDAVMVNFVKLIPYEAMQKAYRQAAMLMHPDHGGDMEKMSQMNAAWQRLEKEFYKRG